MMHALIVAIGLSAPTGAPHCVAEGPLAPQQKGDSDKLYLRGLKVLQAKEPSKAIPILERCVRLERDSPRCYRLLGIAFAQSKPPNGDRAKACYERYVQLEERLPKRSPPAELEDPQWMNPASKKEPSP